MFCTFGDVKAMVQGGIFLRLAIVVSSFSVSLSRFRFFFLLEFDSDFPSVRQVKMAHKDVKYIVLCLSLVHHVGLDVTNKAEGKTNTILAMCASMYGTNA
jgi:hypothetical protein